MPQNHITSFAGNLGAKIFSRISQFTELKIESKDTLPMQDATLAEKWIGIHHLQKTHTFRSTFSYFFPPPKKKEKLKRNLGPDALAINEDFVRRSSPVNDDIGMKILGSQRGEARVAVDQRTELPTRTPMGKPHASEAALFSEGCRAGWCVVKLASIQTPEWNAGHGLGQREAKIIGELWELVALGSGVLQFHTHLRLKAFIVSDECELEPFFKPKTKHPQFLQQHSVRVLRSIVNAHRSFWKSLKVTSFLVGSYSRGGSAGGTFTRASLKRFAGPCGSLLASSSNATSAGSVGSTTEQSWRHYEKLGVYKQIAKKKVSIVESD